MSYETVMNLPVRVRKYWINKHNKMVEKEERELNNDKNTTSTTDVNRYAKTIQKRDMNAKMRTQ